MCYRWTRAKKAQANWAVAPVIFSLESLSHPADAGQGKAVGGGGFGRLEESFTYTLLEHWNVD